MRILILLSYILLPILSLANPLLTCLPSADHTAVVFNITQLSGNNNIVIGSNCTVPSLGSNTISFNYTKPQLLTCGFNGTVTNMYGLILIYNVQEYIISLLYKANISIYTNLLESEASTSIQITNVATNNIQVNDILGGILSICGGGNTTNITIPIQSSICLNHTIIGLNNSDTLQSLQVELYSVGKVIAIYNPYNIYSQLTTYNSVSYWIDLNQVTCTQCILTSIIFLTNQQSQFIAPRRKLLSYTENSAANVTLTTFNPITAIDNILSLIIIFVCIIVLLCIIILVCYMKRKSSQRNKIEDVSE